MVRAFKLQPLLQLHLPTAAEASIGLPCLRHQMVKQLEIYTFWAGSPPKGEQLGVREGQLLLQSHPITPMCSDDSRIAMAAPATHSALRRRSGWQAPARPPCSEAPRGAAAPARPPRTILTPQRALLLLQRVLRPRRPPTAALRAVHMPMILPFTGLLMRSHRREYCCEARGSKRGGVYAHASHSISNPRLPRRPVIAKQPPLLNIDVSLCALGTRLCARLVRCWACPANCAARGLQIQSPARHAALSRLPRSKLELRDFMCHEHCLINFGPRINFITGRNGSGKSAVATAICMAFGATASQVVKEATLADLVRNGAGKAVIDLTISNVGE